MTNEDAAVRLRFYETQVCVRECMAHRGHFAECDFCEDIKMMDKSIKALEKQIPKKVKGKYPFYCPSCGTKVSHGPYCWKCGQRVEFERREVKV